MNGAGCGVQGLAFSMACTLARSNQEAFSGRISGTREAASLACDAAPWQERLGVEGCGLRVGG